MSGDKLLFEDESFDTVVCLEVIEHIKEYKKALNEMKRVLKQGRTCITSTPNRETSDPDNKYHVIEFNYHELKSLLDETFDDVEMRGVFYSDKIISLEKKIKALPEDKFSYIPFFIRTLVPLKLKLLVERILFGSEPYLKEKVENNLTEKDFIIKDDNLDNCLNFVCISHKAV